MAKQIVVYKYPVIDKKAGRMVTLKEGVNFDEYLSRISKKGYSAVKTTKPSLKTMEKWMDEGVIPAIDGCRVEPDGWCPHGFPSKMIAMGII